MSSAHFLSSSHFAKTLWPQQPADAGRVISLHITHESHCNTRPTASESSSASEPCRHRRRARQHPHFRYAGRTFNKTHLHECYLHTHANNVLLVAKWREQRGYRRSCVRAADRTITQIICFCFFLYFCADAIARVQPLVQDVCRVLLYKTRDAVFFRMFSVRASSEVRTISAAFRKWWPQRG